VTDVTQLWLEARVPESDASRVGVIRGAALSVEGSDENVELPAEALVGRGHLVDPVSRTLPVLFAVDNAGGRLAVGTFARAFIVNGDERRVLTVPESSLVDDGGIVVVFVQVEGEAFERRVVRLGARDRGWVEVLAGVSPAEHVVSRGAWSVKLAASSGAIPAHGHSH
jgi:multidrug efflux pump subunit AcrA (membrane-fusion protein)